MKIILPTKKRYLVRSLNMLIKTNNSLLKTFDGKILLKNIHFKISKGDLVYVYGPNGIGKTSLFKAILGLDGLEIDEIEKKAFTYFYLPQIENKEFLLPLKLKDLASENEFLENEQLDLMWNQASGGERKKVMLARALNEDRDLYILDEPYNHLDEASIIKVNKRIEKLLLKNKTVILISHKMSKINTQKIVELDVVKWSY